jgi:hypothetical protein
MKGAVHQRKPISMRLSIDSFLDYTLVAPADLLFAVEVAQMHDQLVARENHSTD